MAQIEDTAHGGERMPPKTTFFHPKPPTGLVFSGARGGTVDAWTSPPPSRSRANHHVIATTRADGTQMSPITVGVDDATSRVVSTRETAYKVAHLRALPYAAICAFTDGFFGEWVQVEGPVDIVSLPDAMGPLVDYYRAIRGEHPDWDDYRAAMERDWRAILRMTVERCCAGDGHWRTLRDARHDRRPCGPGTARAHGVAALAHEGGDLGGDSAAGGRGRAGRGPAGRSAPSRRRRNAPSVSTTSATVPAAPFVRSSSGSRPMAAARR